MTEETKQKMSCCDKSAVDLKKSISLRIGCRSAMNAYPCKNCGRLHWSDGSQVVDRSNNRAFLEGGKLIHKDKEGNIVY